MKKSVFAIITCTMVVLFSGCGNDNTAGAVSSGGNGSEQVIETDITEEQDAPEIQESSSEVSELSEDTADTADTADISPDNVIKVIWSDMYCWEMGADYIYIDSYGRIYEERECEEPMFEPVGACKATYTGKRFTEDELNEFFSIKKDDEEGHKEMLIGKGIKLGR